MSLVEDRNNFYDVNKNWDTHFPSLFSKLELAMDRAYASIDDGFDYADHITPAEALALISGLMSSFDSHGDITIGGKRLIVKEQ